MNTIENLTLELKQVNANQILALAHLVKRIGYADLQALAADDKEAFDMQSAVIALHYALAKRGYDPQ